MIWNWYAIRHSSRSDACLADIFLKKFWCLVFYGYSHESLCKWKLTSLAFRKCILCLGFELENFPKKVSEVWKCGENSHFWREFAIFRQKLSKNCPRILNISNSTPLLLKILCALIEVYLRNILILNWGGNSDY